MKPGIVSSEGIGFIGGGAAALYQAFADPEPNVRIAALVVFGVLGVAYTIARSIVKTRTGKTTP